MGKYKNILITGADGFIGSHLTEMLVKKGYVVKALAQYNSFNNWGWLEEIDNKDQVEVVTGDIRDPYFCKEITKDILEVEKIQPSKDEFISLLKKFKNMKKLYRLTKDNQYKYNSLLKNLF